MSKIVGYLGIAGLGFLFTIINLSIFEINIIRPFLASRIGLGFVFISYLWYIGFLYKAIVNNENLMTAKLKFFKYLLIFISVISVVLITFLFLFFFTSN